MLRLFLPILPLLLQTALAAPGVPLNERAQCEPVKTVTVYVRTAAHESKETSEASVPVRLPQNVALGPSKDKTSKSSKSEKEEEGSFTLDDSDLIFSDVYPTPTGSRTHKGANSPSSSISAVTSRRNVVYFANWYV
jgi:hypothetical protein